MLRDSDTFSSGHIIDMIMGPVMGEHIILGMDGERHRRYRALVSSAFRQKVLTESEDQLVAKVANELIDRFADRGHAELVREFTLPFPTQVIAGILGLPETTTSSFSGGRSPSWVSSASRTRPSSHPVRSRSTWLAF